MTPRMCDGQPNQPCPSNCDMDCDFQTRERALHKAAREFCKPDYSRTPLDGPGRIIVALDWLGNLPYHFGRWLDRTNPGRLFCLSVGGVLAACLASVWLVGLK